MKKTLFIIVAILLTFNTFAQQVVKSHVLVETCTEDGCPYCPAAQQGLEYLVNQGYNVIPLHYHYSSNVGNSDGNARMSFYGVPGFPTSYFNGHVEDVGGGSTESRYVNDYNSVKNETTSFIVSIDSIRSPDHVNYSVYVKVKKIASYSGTNIKLITAVTESSVDYHWGPDHISYLQRGMYPNANGTAISLNEGDSTTIQLDFSISSEWNVDSLYFIAFAQDMSSKEVLNMDMQDLFAPVGQNNVGVFAIEEPQADQVICRRAISPVVIIKNYGLNDLTSCDIKTVINGDTVGTYHWTGTLAPAESATVSLDPMVYNQQENNTLEIIATNPNGTVDPELDDNTQTVSFVKSNETTNVVYLDMNTGQWGFEISYQLLDSAGNILAESGTLSGNQPVQDTFIVPLDQCAYFELYDSYGNGFNNDAGYCTLTDAYGNELFNVTGDFGYGTEYIYRATTEYTDIENTKSTDFAVYPNPASKIVNIRFAKVGNYDVKIYSADGRLVRALDLSNSAMQSIDISSLPAGIYYVKTDNLKTQKLVVR